MKMLKSGDKFLLLFVVLLVFHNGLTQSKEVSNSSKGGSVELDLRRYPTVYNNVMMNETTFTNQLRNSTQGMGDYQTLEDEVVRSKNTMKAPSFLMMGKNSNRLSSEAAERVIVADDNVPSSRDRRVEPQQPQQPKEQGEERQLTPNSSNLKSEQIEQKEKRRRRDSSAHSTNIKPSLPGKISSAVEVDDDLIKSLKLSSGDENSPKTNQQLNVNKHRIMPLTFRIPENQSQQKLKAESDRFPSQHATKQVKQRSGRQYEDYYSKDNSHYSNQYSNYPYKRDAPVGNSYAPPSEYEAMMSIEYKPPKAKGYDYKAPSKGYDYKPPPPPPPPPMDYGPPMDAYGPPKPDYKEPPLKYGPMSKGGGLSDFIPIKIVLVAIAIKLGIIICIIIKAIIFTSAIAAQQTVTPTINVPAPAVRDEGGCKRSDSGPSMIDMAQSVLSRIDDFASSVDRDGSCAQKMSCRMGQLTNGRVPMLNTVLSYVYLSIPKEYRMYIDAFVHGSTSMTTTRNNKTSQQLWSDKARKVKRTVDTADAKDENANRNKPSSTESPASATTTNTQCDVYKCKYL